MPLYEPLIARCRVATNNTNAAVLLYRIAFWMPKAKVLHHGLKWVANSAAQWCQQTGLSFDQHRRAIALLKTKGLVETEQHLFGGKNITHVRLTEKGWALTGKPPLGQGTVASPASADTAQPEKCDSAQLYIKGESSLENLKGESNTAFANAHANCLPSKQKEVLSGEDKKNSNPDPKKNSAFQNAEKFEDGLGSPQINSIDAGVPNHFSADVKASTESPAPTSAISIADSNPADLAAQWKAIIVEKYGDYVPPFTKKEFGQLKEFIKACPPGQALSMLECCLRDWSYFASRAKANYAAFGIPSRPTLDFLVKYRAAAINVALDEAKEAAEPKGVLMYKGVPVVWPEEKTVTPPVIKMKEQPMTKEEMEVEFKDVKVLTYDEIMQKKEDEFYASLKLP